MKDVEVVKKYLDDLNKYITIKEENDDCERAYRRAIASQDQLENELNDQILWIDSYKIKQKNYFIGSIVSAISILFFLLWMILRIVNDETRYEQTGLLIMSLGIFIVILIIRKNYTTYSKVLLDEANEYINDYPELKKKKEEEINIIAEKLQKLLILEKQEQKKFEELENNYPFKLPIRYQNREFIEMSLEIIISARFKSLANLLDLFDKKLAKESF